MGANAGRFPLLLHALGDDVERLTGVEVNPLTHVRLHFNILTNRPEATVLNRAVTFPKGEITVSLGQGDTGDSLRGSPGGAGMPRTIRTMRLDDTPTRAGSTS